MASATVGNGLPLCVLQNVGGIQIASVLPFWPSIAMRLRIFFHHHSVEHQIEHTMGQRLIGPSCVMRWGGHVDVSIQNDEQRPVETERAALRCVHVEQIVPGIP